MEPMGVAHNVLERIDVNGKEVLVIGCGPVGLLCCSVAKVSYGFHCKLFKLSNLFCLMTLSRVT